MNFFKTLLAGAATFVAAHTASFSEAEADTVSDIVNRGALNIAVQTQGPPFSFVDKHGERTGFAVEVVKLIAQDMGVEIEFHDYEWKGLIPSLLAKKVDFIAADMTPTPQRALQLNFTEPFYYSEVVAYTNGNSTAATWQDLNQEGVKIGVPQASSHVKFVRDNLPNATVVELSGGSPAVAQALSVGRVDAGVTAREIAVQFTREFEGVRVVDGVIVKSPLSFPVRPQDTHLQSWLNNWFRIKHADRTIERMLEYWVLTDAWEADHK
ncbi:MULTISPECIES: ABC transporter substrate-binding protein [unclassified Leisingera]|uniref:ABC transporter substrate-binding protein n=1 Tax=unclassified Leisingera TaxID=2614906 RepID=UPI00101196A2|nr:MULTISPECIES: ABC transporter substrate-binding protein [unclassified Leisingera]MBQ4826308.1 amino acid ABC transporter substrate-binding protein [Leisingera sp. HS039]MCF6432963.1 ABC transporter substrate-binding protein [Leisingera sp. MMG026]QAX28142.1 amino acid ABC transporter substrate-binding protein [Leisingera sp. NJS204]QBR37854.1 amino acid ABC transporter substrate-binding protein [Leisingera sp. NJS201]